MCLKKKKMYEGQRTTLDNTKFAMEQQVCPPVPQYFRPCAALPRGRKHVAVALPY